MLALPRRPALTAFRISSSRLPWLAAWLAPWLAAACVLLAAPSVVHAEPIGTPTFKLRVVEEDGARQLTDVESARFFNRAHCLCDVPMQLEITISDAAAHPSDPVEIWVGQQCDTVDDLRDTRCEKLSTQSLSDVRVLRDSETIALTVEEMTWPHVDGCTDSKQEPEKLWLLMDENGDTTFEHAWSYDYNVDTSAPAGPSGAVATGVEDAIQLEWDVIETNTDELYGFQVLCARATDLTPVFEDPSESVYESSLLQCGVDDPTAGPGTEPGPTPDAMPARDASAIDAAGADASTADAAAAIDAAGIDAAPSAATDAAPAVDGGGTAGLPDLLDGRFNCTGQVSKTAGGVRVDLSGSTLDLAAREEVHLWLATIDNHRNPRLIDLGTARPQPVADFWEVYEDQGGSAKGGFCGVAPGGAGGAALGLVVLGSALALVWRARRRRGGRVDRGGPGALGLVLALGVGLAGARTAQAQAFLDEPAPDPTVRPRSEWQFELKLGPYTPDVDSEEGLTGTPYATTYGDGDALMIQIELDHFFAWPAGQLGVGAVVGYTQNTADTFPIGPDGRPVLDDEMRTSDETAFHLFPMAVLAVYRFTALADNTPIPIVPYAKLGLAYYMWWVSKGDGSLASTDDKGDASGGSLGWQGSLGLAVRADAFDEQAAVNLASEYGVEHAGFFFEYTVADVDGFGSEDKLQVGDKSWLAGVNFEF